MTIFEIKPHGIKTLSETTYSEAGLKEKEDLQRLLRKQIEIISPNTLVIAEEFGHWEDSKRRIDLLGVDKDANLVVFELKRTNDGGHMELQAIRYAAMVSTMTFDQAVNVYSKFLGEADCQTDARTALLEFLEWDSPDGNIFAPDVRIVVVAADFSKEITTTVLWLNKRMLDIRCIRLKPYKLDDRIVVDAQQIVPIPEAAEYQIKLKEKEQKERTSHGRKWDEASFLEEIRGSNGEHVQIVVREMLNWLTSRVSHLAWGWGQASTGVFAVVEGADGFNYRIVRLGTNGYIAFWFEKLMLTSPFTDDGFRRSLIEQINRIPDIDPVTETTITKRLRIPIDRLLRACLQSRFVRAIRRDMSPIMVM